jgi:hypothetical protein
MICTLFIHGHKFTFKHLCWHSITKILRNGPGAHFPFRGRELCVGIERDPGGVVAAALEATAGARVRVAIFAVDVAGGARVRARGQ